jgi:hypothetical protein
MYLLLRCVYENKDLNWFIYFIFELVDIIS